MDNMTFPARWLRAALPFVIAATMAFAISSTGSAQTPGSTIEGVWVVTSTPRDCTTGATLGPPVRSLLTFHQGGTVTESAALLLLAPGQRPGGGHGLWTHSGGQNYVERILSLIAFDSSNDPPTFRAGWTLSEQTITLANANNFTSAGRVAFYDTNRQFLRSLCSSRVGERFR